VQLAEAVGATSKKLGAFPAAHLDSRKSYWFISSNVGFASVEA
jgi:hypothetical protein